MFIWWFTQYYRLGFDSCLYDGLLNTTGEEMFIWWFTQYYRLGDVYMMVYSILQARRCLYDGLLVLQARFWLMLMWWCTQYYRLGNVSLSWRYEFWSLFKTLLWLKCRTAIIALFPYFNLVLCIMWDSLSCASISFLTTN